MRIKQYIQISITVIVTTIVFGIMAVNVSAKREIIENHFEEIEIREVIHNYFDKRYLSRANNRVEDFRDIMDNSPQANSFLLSETD